MNIGEIIKSSRERAGISMRELGRLSGVNSSEISKIESGLRPSPNLKTLKKLCRYLDIRLNDLIFEMGLGATYNPKNKILIDYYKNLDIKDVKLPYKALKYKYNDTLKQIKKFNEMKEDKRYHDELIDLIKILEYENDTTKFILNILEEKILNNFLNES